MSSERESGVVVRINTAKHLPGGRGLTKYFVKVALREQSLKATAKAPGPSREINFGGEALWLPGELPDIYKEKMEVSFYQGEPGTDIERIASIMLPINRLSIGREVDLTLDLQLTDGTPTPVQVDLSVHVVGQLRRGFKLIFNQLGAYSSRVDQTLDFAAHQADRVKPYVASRWALVPAVPLSLLFIAALPLVVVLGVAGAPLLLPLVVLAVVVGASLCVATVAIAASSRRGRDKLAQRLRPVLSKLTDTAVGQEILFNTGPMPPLPAVAALFVPTGMWGKLAASLAIDAIGNSSYLVPVLGEGADLAWAPLQAFLIAGMYSKSSPYAPYFGFAEEILPFTDIVPTATLAWVKENAPVLYKQCRGHILGREPAYEEDHTM